MNLLGTNDEVGTFPEDIVRAVRELGLRAEPRENASLDDLAAETAAGRPVIVLGQFWRSEKDAAVSAADEWDCGHYIVVLSVDDDYVYFQDPYARNGKGFAPRASFEEHWHQIMGGSKDPRSSKLMHVAIFVEGARPASLRAGEEAALADFDLTGLGSMSVMTVHFPRVLMPFDLLDELRSLSDDEMVRPDAFVLLRRDDEGRISALQGGRLEQAKDVAEVNAVIAALATANSDRPEELLSAAQAAAREAERGDFGFSSEQLKARAERLPNGHSEIIVLFENVWQRRFRDVVSRHGGTLEAERFVSSATLAQFGRKLAAEKPRLAE